MKPEFNNQDSTLVEQNNTVKLVRLSSHNHSLIRLLAARQGTTIQALVNSAVEQVYGDVA